jgi:hypothetical protein
VGLEAQAALIVAAFDLKVVQSLRQAIALADLNSAKERGPLTPDANIGPRRNLQPMPRIEQRRVFHPTPRIEPRETIHVQSRVISDPPAPASQPVTPCHFANPFQPPWKILPWNSPIPPTPVIKLVQHRLDIKNKGSLIDIFI